MGRVVSFGVSRAEKHGRPPVIRFPDSRRESASRTFPSVQLSGGTTARDEEPTDQGTRRSVTAYSGGTVWASHPLRITAGVTSIYMVSGVPDPTGRGV